MIELRSRNSNRRGYERVPLTLEDENVANESGDEDNERIKEQESKNSMKYR